MMLRHTVLLTSVAAICLGPGHVTASDSEATVQPLMRVVDLDVGEKATVVLSDGSTAAVELIALDEQRDPFRNAVRQAVVTVKVNEQEVRLASATYHLPVRVAGVQIDCAVTSGFAPGPGEPNAWGLDKAARLRLWSENSPWIRSGTFQYPAKQRWFATQTQMANVPCYVDGGELPANKKIYYHYGLDIGGAEAMVDVVAATDGLVVSARGAVLDGYKTDTPVSPRGDVVYLRDHRGWYYRYSHLDSIDPSIQLGRTIKLGDPIGVLGKKGASGGWSHLHFGMDARQPSGKWGAIDGYAFLWQAYLQQYKPKILAVARPHHLAATGEEVILNAGKSWSAKGKISSYAWLSGNRRVFGKTTTRVYHVPGTYCETLRVTDSEGNAAYDFAEVQVIDPQRLDKLPPTIHPTYAPTGGIKAGDFVTFKVRSFRAGAKPTETWDFGDGTKPVEVHSDGNADAQAKDGYAVTRHAFARPGDYLVSVTTTNEHGFTAVGRLHVRVAGKPRP